MTTRTSPAHRYRSRLILFSVVLLLASLISQATIANEPPALAVPTLHTNVILIMTDDQGYGDIGIHGNEVISTPELDKLAQESFRFTNFHVDPTCSETRAALMTGKYATRVGVWHTIMGRSILRREEVTMADVFRSNGFRTGHFGKWHLGDNYPYRPQDRGFDVSVHHGGGGVGQTPDQWGNDYFDDRYWRNDEVEQFKGYCTDVFFSEAKQFIRRNRDRPFFCYIATNAPHGPYIVDEKYSAPYLAKGVPETMARFYGMITNIDENIAALRKTLTELELDQNTILVFLTDNGTAAGVANGNNNDESGRWGGFNAGMRGKKGSQYDGGHRVPCFIHWPAGNIVGGTSSALSAHFDLLPTLIDLVELKVPFAESLDGRSLRPTMLSQDNWDDRVVCVHSQRVDQPIKGKKCAVMKGDWRLVDRTQLYSLNIDPGQVTDVSEQHPELVDELNREYDRWWTSISTRFNENVAIDIGASESPEVLLTGHDWHAPQPQVPWHPNMIKRDLAVNGVWYINVVNDGNYRLTLRSRPPGVDEPLSNQPGVARIKIQGKEVRTSFEAGEAEVTLEVNLTQGETALQTWLSMSNGQSRGAYFVSIEPSQVVASDDAQTEILFRSDDRVALLGGTFFERMQEHNYFESFVVSARPDLNVTFRNLGWSGDDVFGTARAVFGPVEEGYQRRLTDLKKANPTVAVICYGGNESFSGADGVASFRDAYVRLLDDIRSEGIRVILCSPHRLEFLGSPFPNPEEANRNRKLYGETVKEIAAERGVPFIDLFEPLPDQRSSTNGIPIIRDRLTDQTQHFTAYGYWRIAPFLAHRFGITSMPIKVELAADNPDGAVEVSGAEIGEAERTKDRVAFQLAPKNLSFTGPPQDHPRGGQMTATHDVIRIEGLNPGRYGLNINGKPTLLANHDQWSQGVFLILGDYLESTRELRSEIAQKNENFFHFYRPQNETYLFLFRKHEQGNNAVEVKEFLPLVTEADERIHQLAQPGSIKVELVPVAD